MREAVTLWIQYLQGNNGVLGVALMGAGFCFMVGGWRFARPAIIVTYALIGLGTGLCFGADRAQGFFYGGLAGCACAVLGMLTKRVAPAILAGVVGALVLWAAIGSSTMPDTTVYIVLAITLVTLTAVSMINLRAVIIITTSFVGAVFLASGLIALIHESRILTPHFREMAGYGIFYPFLLLVPTVTGITLQLGAATKQDTGNVNV